MQHTCGHVPKLGDFGYRIEIEKYDIMKIESFRALGAAALLGSQSALYKLHPLDYFVKCLSPPIYRNNYILVSEEERSMGIMTWGTISDDLLERIINSPGYMIEGNEWSDGDNIFIGDIITNGLSSKRLMTHLIKRLARNSTTEIHWQNRRNSNEDNQFKYNSTMLPPINSIPAYYNSSMNYPSSMNEQSLFHVDIGKVLLLATNTVGWSNIALTDFFELVVNAQMKDQFYSINCQDDIPVSFITASGLTLLLAKDHALKLCTSQA